MCSRSPRSLSHTYALSLLLRTLCLLPRADATAMAGKWDAGMATPDHTPHGRGYQSELTYFSHCNDYWTYGISGCLSPTPSLVTDLWNLPPGGSSEGEGPGSDMVPQCNFTDMGDWSMQKVMGESCTSAPNGDTWYGKCASWGASVVPVATVLSLQPGLQHTLGRRWLRGQPV